MLTLKKYIDERPKGIHNDKTADAKAVMEYLTSVMRGSSVEAYNHTIGEKANNVDAFAEAYLAVLSAELDEQGVYRIRDSRIINLYGTDDAKNVLMSWS